tara:strand:+ start:237 stop:518 length:282 start_codon:yes stop_codon:yes gene_type:complete
MNDMNKTPKSEDSPREEVGRKSLLAFNLWLEGYKCTGNENEAIPLGTWRGVDFSGACQNWATATMSEHFEERDNTVWGCRIYDNEAAARASFG